MTATSNTRENGTAARGSQRGFGIIEVVVVMCLLTVAICTAALITAKGVLQARHARVRTDARTAASALVNAEAPAGTGGSVAPAAPLSNWHDVVIVDASTGAFLAAPGTLPEGAVPIRRQWQVATVNGARVYSVSAEILGADGRTPLPAAQGGGLFVFNRVVR